MKTTVVACMMVALSVGSGCAGASGSTADDGLSTNDSVMMHGANDIQSKVLLLDKEKPASAVPVATLAAGTAVELEVSAGLATFEGSATAATVRADADGSVALPRVDPGLTGEDSIITLTVSGKVAGTVRVRGLARAEWAQLQGLLAASADAVLARGEGYVAVDELAVAADDRGALLEMGTASDHPADGSGVEKGLCIRAAWGPGKVNWGSSDPWGQGFSVKPESSSSLVRAAAPSQSIDGIYRRSWGCGSAHKVADSCTATVSSSGSISCCCNAAMQALGHTCSWVNPGNIGFPRCPL